MKIIKYKKDFGEYSFPEGFKEVLLGKSVEEQLKYFRITFMNWYYDTPWQDRRYIRGCVDVKESSDVKAIIVDEDIVVGAMIENEYCTDEPCFIDHGVCAWYARDNNGAGYKERIDYAFFMAVGEKFDENK